MKLITLNIWGGRVGDKLPDFFRKYGDTDILCFQEVFRNFTNRSQDEEIMKTDKYQLNPDLFEGLKEHLPDHKGEFCPTFRGTYGLAAFFKQGIEILDQGETFIARGDWETNPDIDTKDHHRKLQWLELRIDGKSMLIANVHCTHRPKGKGDIEKRLKQSKMIIDFLQMFDCPKILVGDFNLQPDTESIEMIGRSGMKNLVKEYKVPTTRTELYKRWDGGPKFADYIFVSPEIKVNDFKVLPDVVSDHAPLYLDFNL